MRDLGDARWLPSTEPDPAVNRDGKPTGGGTTLPAVRPDRPGSARSGRGGSRGPARPSRPERPGAIGKYLVVDQLDEGGQAQVYRVIHPKLGKDMVLKLGRQPVGDDERTSLVAEGRLLADLEHINLVRIYDLRLPQRPAVPGDGVRARPEPRGLRPRRAGDAAPGRRLVARLAGALAMVHRRGVIHRDIKPRNILIDEAGEPRLIDFGLARLRNAWSDPSPTTWGGTLAYMAPEQARLEHDRIGPRSDIFGLGAVLYFLLTGRPPFAGETQDEVWDRAGVAISRPAPCGSPGSRAGSSGSA